MSELKTFTSERIYWAVEQVERKAGDIDDLHLDDNLFYMKSEVDALLAEKDKEIESMKASHYAEMVDAGMRERGLHRALWLTRGAVHKAKRKAMYSLLQAYPLWDGRPAGLEVHKNIHRYDGYERKCRAKAEEYK